MSTLTCLIEGNGSMNSFLTPEMAAEMLADTNDSERRRLFFGPLAPSADPAVNLQRLCALLRELELFLPKEPSRQVPSGEFIL